MPGPHRTPSNGILDAIREPYALADDARAEPLGNGHINETVLVRSGDRRLVAQRVNTVVFRDPRVLVHNARLVEEHLEGKTGSLREVRHRPGADW